MLLQVLEFQKTREEEKTDLTSYNTKYATNKVGSRGFARQSSGLQIRKGFSLMKKIVSPIQT